MDIDANFSRRDLVKWGLISTAATTLAPSALAQNLGPGNRFVGDNTGRDAEKLFTGHPVVGGGQMEIRLNQSIHTSDPHVLEVGRRLEPFNPLSWYNEWRRIADMNEEIAEGYAAQGLNVSANQFYLRAFRFHRASIVYQEDTDATMMPGYMKTREMFDKAWEMAPPPIERVTVNVDGNDLDGYFRRASGRPGTRHPVVIGYLGADSMAESTILGSGSYASRGMSSLVVDLPGQGAAKRINKLYMPPDTERLVSDLIDYLETRADVDADRIGIRGISMGGYAAPRAATADSRIKAIVTSAGSYDVQSDLFDYYPPIQDRVRWIIGARDLTAARRQLRDYNMEGIARNIECPMLIGYGPTDRIMDPQGAYNLHQAAVNSDSQMWSDAGHPHHDEKSGGPLDLRLPTAQDWMAKKLGSIA